MEQLSVKERIAALQSNSGVDKIKSSQKEINSPSASSPKRDKSIIHSDPDPEASNILPSKFEFKPTIASKPTQSIPSITPTPKWLSSRPLEPSPAPALPPRPSSRANSINTNELTLASIQNISFQTPLLPSRPPALPKRLPATTSNPIPPRRTQPSQRVQKTVAVISKKTTITKRPRPIDPRSKKRYEAFFDRLLSGDGVPERPAWAQSKELLSGATVQEIWSRSRLLKGYLRIVWDLCDTKRVGRLDKTEFIRGMWMIDEELRRCEKFNLLL